AFYDRCCADIEKAKQTRSYGLDGSKLNYFDASYIPWLSYEALHVELPDGHLHFPPIINWGKYRSENERLMMPLTVRMNHAVADGYVVSKAFLLLEKEIERLVEN
ncbi:CatA-like O-acetyltransferase, partial [Phascolarctobacterium faecium]